MIWPNRKMKSWVKESNKEERENKARGRKVKIMEKLRRANMGDRDSIGETVL